MKNYSNFKLSKLIAFLLRLEAQDGNFNISIDGDLFKVVIVLSKFEDTAK